MIEFDAAERPGRYPDSDPHPRRDGHRVTDLLAMGGGLIWVVFVATAWVGIAALDAVELFVALALLVCVPLGLGLAATPRRSGGRSLPYSLAVTLQLPAAALAGRAVTEPGSGFGGAIAGRVAAASTVVIVVNLALIAVGITFSPLVEVVAVSLFTVAVAGFALFVLLPIVPTTSRLPGALLAVSAASVVATMALSLAYGYSAFPATGELIAIGEMVRYHGTLNAFGFALPALLAFRLAAE